MVSFTKQKIFVYNQGKKRKFAFYSFFVLTLIVLLIVFYFAFLKNTDFFLINLLNELLGHIKFHLFHKTLLGVFYASVFGGLFFLPTPLEIIFLGFLKSGISPGLLIFIYLIGLLISYTANYFIGRAFTETSKKLISYRRFYKIKGFINKFGALGIFIFNVLPLPSQPLAAILGVFKYNKTRFYVYTILGQSIKYFAIILGYFYIM